ncbi:hypothetical protein L1987_09904 [Smallanthus sonchifolius]|uniref:Uncharacterized protein n=1 Tax=Smallanthus sonchifolius TaxID=185202 RepID=A0ACB9JQL6_9ASTR|nr:hypothetical protein L1987_09904 [Smallanthus sonchifolius]
MHRQSLGSPAYKLHSHGVLFAGDGVIKNDIDSNLISEDLQSHRKDKLASCSASGADDEQRKSPKPYLQRHILISSSTRLVHLIPLLTFLCFLILYLSSHDPSRKDLAQFTGFTTISSKKTVIDSIDLDDNAGGGFLEIEKNDALAIRSMRNLQQQERHRLHRKLGQ